MANVHKETLTSVSEFKTFAAHITALGKLRLKTEDTTLSKHIEAVIAELQTVHIRSSSKSTPVSVANAKSQSVKALVAYCKQIIGTQKPEWQILAEKNGWGPK